MPVSEQKAKDLASIEPPPSIEGILRFLKSLTANNGAALRALSTPTPLAPPSGPPLSALIGQRTSVPLQSNQAQAFHALVLNYSVRVEELEQFTQWLTRFNDKRQETETLNPEEAEPSQYPSVRRRGQTPSAPGTSQGGERFSGEPSHGPTSEPRFEEPVGGARAPVRRRPSPSPGSEPLDLKPMLSRAGRGMLTIDTGIAGAVAGAATSHAPASLIGPSTTQVIHDQMLVPFVPKGWVPATPTLTPQTPFLGGARATPQPLSSPTFTPSLPPPASPAPGIDPSSLRSRSFGDVSKGFGTSSHTATPGTSRTPSGLPGSAQSSFGSGPTGVGSTPSSSGSVSPPPNLPSYQPPLADLGSRGIAEQLAHKPDLATSVIQRLSSSNPELFVPSAAGSNPMLSSASAVGQSGSAMPSFGATPMQTALSAGRPSFPFSVTAGPSHAGSPPPGTGPASASFVHGFPPAASGDPMRSGTPAPGMLNPNVNPTILFGTSRAPASASPAHAATWGGTQGAAQGATSGATPPPALTPEHGQLTIIAPPLTIASQDAAAAGSGVQMDWSSLADTAGTMTASSLSSLASTLPQGAQAIYPALTPNRMAPGAFSLNLGPSVLGHLMGAAYGPQAATHASAASRSAPTKPPASGKVPASLVPLQRPAGGASSLLPTKGANAAGPGALAQAGSHASRSGPMDFLGLPVRVAPSLAASPALRDEVAVRGAAADLSANKAVSPEKFNLLKSKVMPSIHSMDVEPNKAAWAKAAPNFGLQSSDPLAILSPSARQNAHSAAGPTPSSTIAPKPQGGTIPMLPASAPIRPTAAIGSHLPGIGGGLSSVGPSSASPTPYQGMAGHSGFPSGPTLDHRLGRPRSNAVTARDLGPSPGATVPQLPPAATPGTPNAYSHPPLPAIHQQSPGHTVLRNTPPLPPLPGAIGGGVGPRVGAAARLESREGSFRRSPPPFEPRAARRAPMIPGRPQTPMSVHHSAGGAHGPAPTHATPDMLYAAPPASKPRFVVQKSPIGGQMPRSAGGPSGSAEPSSPKKSQSPKSDSANVDLLASEVWTLLKRRLTHEAERRGRW